MGIDPKTEEHQLNTPQNNGFTPYTRTIKNRALPYKYTPKPPKINVWLIITPQNDGLAYKYTPKPPKTTVWLINTPQNHPKPWFGL